MSSCYNLSIDSNTPMSEVLEMPLSYGDIFYDSSAWDDRKHDVKKTREERNSLFKLGNEIIKALNNIIKKP